MSGILRPLKPEGPPCGEGVQSEIFPHPWSLERRQAGPLQSFFVDAGLPALGCCLLQTIRSVLLGKSLPPDQLDGLGPNLQ